MPESLLIGTRGWEHPGWRGRFYPEELPEDWRFCYYSNWLRAVLVPAETWGAVTRGEVRAWAEDCDPEFRFVLELPAEVTAPAPPSALRAQLAEFFKTIEPIRSRTAGLVVPADHRLEEPDAFAALLGRLAQSAFPLCVDLPAARRTPAFLEAAAAHGAGLLWHCTLQSVPPPDTGGGLLVAVARTADPRTQRRLLEALSAWQAPGGGGTAALFFDDPIEGAEQAKQARSLAELMGL